MLSRRIAVAIPALNEAERITSCIEALSQQRLAGRAGHISIVVLANNCADDTAAVIRARFSGFAIDVREVSLLKPHNHAGWARRLSFDAAVLSLIAEWRSLHPAHRARFNRLRKYYTLLAYLRRERHGLTLDPWPRHEYEGGASIAMTLGLYRRLGELQTPAVGEDKALFRAIERAGGRIRHPLDVRVFTSCRYSGRARGGMADTIAEWGRQGDDTPIHGAWPLNVELGHAPQARSRPLTFRTLDQEIAKARMLACSERVRRLLDISA